MATVFFIVSSGYALGLCIRLAYWGLSRRSSWKMWVQVLTLFGHTILDLYSLFLTVFIY